MNKRTNSLKDVSFRKCVTNLNCNMPLNLPDTLERAIECAAVKNTVILTGFTSFYYQIETILVLSSVSCETH